MGTSWLQTISTPTIMSNINFNKLENTVLHYCGEICNRKVLQRIEDHRIQEEKNTRSKGRNKNKKDKNKGEYGFPSKYKWDFPAAAVACCSVNNNTIFKNYSRGGETEHTDDRLVKKFNARRAAIKNRKQKIGSFNPIGHCAEQQAANDLLKKQKKTLIEEIYFSNAYRPKTLQYIPYCENCQEIFNNCTNTPKRRRK